MGRFEVRNWTTAAAALSMFLFSAPLGAVDGVVLIDQNKALAGNITPGDAPGFPVTISQPGSYRLSSNLNVPLAPSGTPTIAIQIAANGVTLDLNGFSIIGPGTFVDSTGINGTGSSQATVSNGTVIGFVYGLRFEGQSQYIRAEKLHLLTTTSSPAGPVSSLAMVIGRDRVAYAILREITTDGQIQITCPSLVSDTVVSGGQEIVEMNVPFDGGGFSFPRVCKGENVIQ